jgi:amidophosphoribosyltransferase
MCGIAGVFLDKKMQSLKNIVTTLVMGLHALQHRGQDSCGLSCVVDGLLQTIKSEGLIGQSWAQKQFISLKGGFLGLGHVRYPTAGKKGGDKIEQILNAQPFQIYLQGIGSVALVHNGTITNANKYRRRILKKGQTFQSDTDSEVALRMLALERGSLVKRLKKICQKLKGGFSFILITQNQLLGVRGQYGFWPLVIGKKNNSFMLASETSALDTNEFKYLREVKPGEIVVIKKQKVQSFLMKKVVKPSPCLFELVYFSRPDSITFGKSVSRTRRAIGRELAKEHKIDADMVIGMPDSGVAAAIGYAQTSGIPYEQAIIRNHYEHGRSFLKATTKGRRLKTMMKLALDRNILQGKTIIIVDDSMVRGNTFLEIVRQLKNAGVKKIIFLLTCPPIQHPCLMGIDTPTYKELFAHSCKNVAEVQKKAQKKLGVHFVGFVSIKGLYKACGFKYHGKNSKFCDGCFTGDYPIKIPT